ncbi:MAG TPA: hypothetical protein VL088_09545 [Pedobacter sp.]|nr:hypothetical protein [Pedobacter sp.]
MKNLSILTIALIATLLLSCDKSPEKITAANLQKITTINTNGLTKQYVLENRFIDVDLDIVNKEINDRTKNKYQKPELAKAKAAIYRFYKNVSIKDGHYIQTIKSAKELNISDKLFLLFSTNIQKMNKSLDSLRAKKVEVEMPPADEKYFNSLLN